MNRTTLKHFVEHPYFENFILGLIILNAIILGLETNHNAMAKVGPTLLFLDGIILAIFVVELVLRLAADFKGFWRNPWRIFDLAGAILAPVADRLPGLLRRPVFRARGMPVVIANDKMRSTGWKPDVFDDSITGSAYYDVQEQSVRADLRRVRS